MTRTGRPPKDEATMLRPMSIRLSPAMMDDLEAEVARRRDGAEKAQVMREAIALGLAQMKRRKTQ